MPSLTSLAEDLLSQAKKIDAILEQNNIPPTSFDEDTLESLPAEAQKLRWDLSDASHNFRQLVRGARLSGIDLAFAWTDQVILRIIWRYKLASAIPLNGSATYSEIAAASGLGTAQVIRTIRAAMTLKIFDESEPGRVCHTAISKLLATNEGFSNLVGLQVNDIGPSSAKVIEAWAEVEDDTGEPDKSALALYNNGQPVYAVFAQDPVRAQRFDSALRYFTGDEDFNISEMYKAFDWSKLDQPGSLLVDLGGGFGQMVQVLAKHTQHLSFTIQDLPHVAERGRKELPSELQQRISFEAQNFMEAQQPRDGYTPDAFLISRVLHNWSDHNASHILRSLIPVLRKGSRVLIWDTVLDDRPAKKLSEKFNPQQDLIMAVVLNAKERSAEDFRQLLELSDARFKIESISRPEGSKNSLIEVSWDCC